MPVWLEEHFLLMMLTAASLVSGIWLWKVRNRLGMTFFSVLLTAVLHTLYGVLTVKVFALVEDGTFQWAGKMSLFGGVFLMPVFYFIMAKITKKCVGEVFDIFTVCLVSTLFFARFNCLISGCCFGRMIPGMEPIRWPTRELELIYYLVFLALVIPKIWKKESKGTAYPLYMISYGVFRFITECFRDNGTNQVFHIAHIWAVISFVIGMSFYIELQNTKNTNRRG